MENNHENATDESAVLNEITSIPIWVKGILVVGLILFLIRMPYFRQSFSDAVVKSKAETAVKTGKHLDAILHYKKLLIRYPEDKKMIQALGTTYYHAGQYDEAINTFSSLTDVMLDKEDAEAIDGMIKDIFAKMADRINNK